MSRFDVLKSPRVVTVVVVWLVLVGVAQTLALISTNRLNATRGAVAEVAADLASLSSVDDLNRVPLTRATLERSLQAAGLTAASMEASADDARRFEVQVDSVEASRVLRWMQALLAQGVEITRVRLEADPEKLGWVNASVSVRISP